LAVNEGRFLAQRAFSRYGVAVDADRNAPLATPLAESPASSDGFELEMLVRRSDEDVTLFDAQQIAEVLVRETRLDMDRARQIAGDVRQLIEKIGPKNLSSAMIRALVNARLLALGLEDVQLAHSRLGVPVYDVNTLLLGSRQDVAAPDPETTSIYLGEAIKREYAIRSVLSEAAANAHAVGDIHVERLGAIDRIWSVAANVDHIKRYGPLSRAGLPASAPARDADELTEHLAVSTLSLLASLAGPVVWDGLVYAFAPFVEDLDADALNRLARKLIHRLATAAAGSPCDIHLDWVAPAAMAHRRAIGPGGALSDHTYDQYSESARALLVAILTVLLEGDATGRPYLEPRAVIHVSRSFTERPGYRLVLDLIGRLAVERGGATVVFDRSDWGCFFSRYGFNDERMEAEEPSAVRSSALQVVALNLPRVGFLASSDQVRVFEELTRVMEAAAQAHLEKRVFLEKLLAQGADGSLALLTTRRDGRPFLRLPWATHLIAPVGLQELGHAVLGRSLGEDASVQDFARRVVGHLRREVERLSSKHQVRFALADPGAMAAARRFARLDLRFFEPQAAEISGTRDPNAVVGYTPGLHVSPAAELDLLERLRIEGSLHASRVLGAATRLDFSSATAENVGVLLSQALFQSEAAGIAFALPAYECLNCGAMVRASKTCTGCGAAAP
jgi:ribonucleoside-triphosphate reductase